MRVHWRSLVHVTDYIFSLCLLLFGGCHCQSDGGGGGAGHATQYPIHYYTRLKKKKSVTLFQTEYEIRFFSSTYFAVAGQEDTSKLLSLKQHSGFLSCGSRCMWFAGLRPTHGHSDRRCSPLRCILK